MMECSSLDDIEELTLCSCCKRTFDDVERPPKLLACKHHFCLECARGVLGAGREVCCMHCSARTAPPGGLAAALPTHAAVLALARRLAPARRPRAPRDAQHCRELRTALCRLAARRRDLMLRALDATTALKLRLEAELAAPADPMPACDTHSLPAAVAERDRLQAIHSEALVQCRLDDLIRTATVPLDFDVLRRTLTGFGPVEPPVPLGQSSERRDPILFLANYCTAQLFGRQWAALRVPAMGIETVGGEAHVTFSSPTDGEMLLMGDTHGSPSTSNSTASVASPLLRNPGPYPLFFFELEVNGVMFGRVVIEVRDDLAPRMARNFSALTTGELGVGYRGCTVFQCWENESVITGDYEQNNGRGGRSMFEEHYFMPDETRLVALRGTVGMRRSQKRHDSQGLVGSQFRIVLREMRGFTAIFAFVVEGLELVDQLSRTGDSAGKPHSTILISSCGKLN